jgi:hypothetical protein
VKDSREYGSNIDWDYGRMILLYGALLYIVNLITETI